MGERRGVLPLLDLRQSLVSALVKFELEQVDVVGGLHHHVHAAVGGVPLGLRVEAQHLEDERDGTFNYGNPVWHTYGPYMMANPVTLVVTDTFGRDAVKRAYAMVNANPFEHGSLHTFSTTGPEEFSFDTPNIEFKPRKAGVYRVALTVIGADGCVAEAELSVVCSGK